MKIVINKQNEIVAYCIVGNLDNSIETIKSFPSNFESKKFIYDKLNDEILENPNYIENRAEIEAQIKDYKELLSASDYKALKYMEGYLTEDEYAETKAQRQEWRNKINELEEMLKNPENKAYNYSN